MDPEVNVLVLDDERNVLNALKRVFRGETYGIAVTTDPREALELVDSGNIKVVISDQRMPEISGIDFLDKVKKIRPDIIRMLITGYSDIKIAEDAINKGEVYRFIDKPWDDVELKLLVRSAIEKFDMSARIVEQNGELRSVNEQLKEMYESQKEFSSTVSHELRTPLASIQTIIEVLISESAGGLNPDQMNFLNKVKANVDRLDRLVNDILSLSRMEHGKFSLGLKADDINDVIKEVVECQAPVAEKKGIYLKMSLKTDVGQCCFDRGKIDQLLSNLVNNAIKFTDKGGVSVTSEYDRESRCVKVSVRDTGKGIKSEDMGRIFEKFQQLGDPASRGGGTGLGLAICREIVTRHHGKIWVESEFGEGSVFYFTIPAGEEVDNDREDKNDPSYRR